MPEPKLTRREVREIVDREAEFSEKWDVNRTPGTLADADKPVEVWLAWMLVHINEALKATAIDYDKTKALHSLRCALNLGEICAQHHGLPAREPDDKTDLYT